MCSFQEHPRPDTPLIFPPALVPSVCEAVVVSLAAAAVPCAPWGHRDSKFTRLIADTLGGYSNTVLLACVAPGGSREDETLTTIRYSQLASRILNKPQVGVLRCLP